MIRTARWFRLVLIISSLALFLHGYFFFSSSSFSHDDDDVREEKLRLYQSFVHEHLEDKERVIQRGIKDEPDEEHEEDKAIRFEFNDDALDEASDEDEDENRAAAEIMHKLTVINDTLCDHIKRVTGDETRYSIPMVSDMSSTKHEWPWVESRAHVEDCMFEEPLRGIETPPGVCIVISFHNQESLISLLHTLHSLQQRTPRSLLNEINLIDDGTMREEFSIVLPTYIRAVFHGLVRLLRNEKSEGLVRSRLRGIKACTSQVAVVLDSHVEVQEGWLEPLLKEILLDRKTLASSVLDWMSKTDSGWEYKHGGYTWKTVFDWSFLFSFHDMSPTEKRNRRVTDAYNTPMMIGGVWAMNISYFYRVGAMDDGMDFWGGENIDLSVRVWLMGGRVVNVPCSRIAHFESSTSRSYRNGKDNMIHRNYKRFVDVWMDDYDRLFYRAFPELKDADVGDLSARRLVRERAVHNFSWFLQNVSPQLGIPDRDSYAWGRLVHGKSGMCLTYRYGAAPYLLKCNPTKERDQSVYWSLSLALRLPMTIFISTRRGKSYELEPRESTSLYKEEHSSKWIHWPNGPLVDIFIIKCLTVPSDYTKGVVMESCVNSAENQTWNFAHYSPSYVTMLETNSNRQYKYVRKKIHKYQSILRTNGTLRHAL